MRTHKGLAEAQRRRALSTSADGGLTWSKVSFDDTLIEPVCQASLLRVDDPKRPERKLMLFSNPASKDKRAKMTVRLSEDDGKTWPTSRLVHDGPAAYSCLTVLPDGVVGCLYERGEKQAYETITFECFRVEDLR
jgi:sialidase-1